VTTACAWLLIATAPGAAGPIAASSVWVAPEGAVQELQSRCGPVQTGRAACYRAVAARHGAAPAAQEAIGLLQGEGHITGFRDAGRVSLAAGLFPFRANQNDAVLVVNGDPPVLDVDGPLLLARLWDGARIGETAGSPALLFPGERVPLDAVRREETPDGGLRLLLPYALRACRACPTQATLWYRLGFDAGGRFDGVAFARGDGEAAALAPDQAPAQVVPGAVVLIRLPATPSTGYVWQMDAMPPDGPLRLLWHAYRPAGSPRPGSPGEEFWWLEAVRPGPAEFTLRSVRPWEPSRDAVASRFRIEVAAP
jgi:predicted secreted protein